MIDTISFVQIIKLVHPDTNPQITDPGEKVKTIKLYRKDEKTLYKLGVLWGVIKSDKVFTNDTATPSPSESSIAQKRYEERKLREYKAHLAAQKREEERRSRERREERNSRESEFSHRVRNRIFLVGDVVYILTKRSTVIITRVTKARVYFTLHGKETYASKKNVQFTR